MYVAEVKSDLRNMTETLIFISILFTVIIIPRTIVTLIYSSRNQQQQQQQSLIFSMITWIDLVYSIYFNSIFFILVTQNELFTVEFKNLYFTCKKNPNESSNHI